MIQVSNQDMKTALKIINAYLDITDESTMSVRENRRKARLLTRKWKEHTNTK